MLGRLLAQAAEGAAERVESIEQVRQMVEDMHLGWPEWVHQTLALMPVAVLIVLVLIWQRQKTIARNQVQIAQMLDELVTGRRS